jgi:hypothetical protein
MEHRGVSLALSPYFHDYEMKLLVGKRGLGNLIYGMWVVSRERPAL